jgi:hypothetical protein
LRRLIEDDDFVENYSHVLFELHNKVASQLSKNLNANLPVNRSFYENLSRGSSIFTETTEGSSLPRDSPFSESANVKKKPQPETDVHLFRSFRIIGLRHPITTTTTKTTINSSKASSSKHSKHSTTNNDPKLCTRNRLKVEPVSEIVEIRCSFDIKQFDHRSKYDCFIECELSYYKVQPESVSTKKRPSNIYNHSNLESAHQHHQQHQQHQQQQQNSQQRYNHTSKNNNHRTNTDSQYFNYLDANLTNSTNRFIKHLRLSVSSDDIYDYPCNEKVFKMNDSKNK